MFAAFKFHDFLKFAKIKGFTVLINARNVALLGRTIFDVENTCGIQTRNTFIPKLKGLYGTVFPFIFALSRLWHEAWKLRDANIHYTL